MSTVRNTPTINSSMPAPTNATTTAEGGFVKVNTVTAEKTKPTIGRGKSHARAIAAATQRHAKEQAAKLKHLQTVDDAAGFSKLCKQIEAADAHNYKEAQAFKARQARRVLEVANPELAATRAAELAAAKKASHNAYPVRKAKRDESEVKRLAKAELDLHATQ